MTDIIFLFGILFMVIIGVIVYYFTVIRPYKKAVANLKVGDKYTITIEEDDYLFDKTEILECTIVEVWYGKDKEPYVKYEFSDGSAGTTRFDKFFKQFDKVN